MESACEQSARQKELDAATPTELESRRDAVRDIQLSVDAQACALADHPYVHLTQGRPYVIVRFAYTDGSEYYEDITEDNGFNTYWRQHLAAARAGVAAATYNRQQHPIQWLESPNWAYNADRGLLCEVQPEIMHDVSAVGELRYRTDVPLATAQFYMIRDPKVTQLFYAQLVDKKRYMFIPH